MGKTIFTALISAIVASVITALIVLALSGDEARERLERERLLEKRILDSEDQVSVALERVDRMRGDLRQAEKRALGAAMRTAAEGTDAAVVGEDGRLVAPDGSALVSKAEMDAAIEAFWTEKGGPGALFNTEAFEPEPAKTLSEIADEMGLTTQQEATLSVILRESEQDLVNILFGERPLEDVKDEIRAVKDDPDAQAELLQRTMTRAFANMGKLFTHEARLEKRVKNILGDEVGAEFLGKNRKPELDPDFEEFLEEVF